MRTRLRSTIKWSATVLTVLLLVVWVGSAWWVASFRLQPTVSLLVYAGEVLIDWQEPWSVIPASTSSDFARHSAPFSWWFDVYRVTAPSGTTFNFVSIPIWVLVVLFATPTIWLWRGDWRKQPGLCIKCGYDLRANTTGICPECGHGS